MPGFKRSKKSKTQLKSQMSVGQEFSNTVCRGVASKICKMSLRELAFLIDPFLGEGVIVIKLKIGGK